jgi:hypothetical protein
MFSDMLNPRGNSETPKAARVVLIGFFMWALWLAFEYVFLGPHSYVLIHDWGDSFVPLYIGQSGLNFSEFFGGWESRIMFGMDLASQSISQLKLTKLLSGVMPAWLVLGVFNILQRFIAGYFMYRLVRDVLTGDRWAGIACGAVYAVGLQTAGQAMYAGYTNTIGIAIPAIPFLIWLNWRLLHESVLKRVVMFFAVGASISISSQQIQAWAPMVCFGLMALALTPKEKWFRLLTPFTALATGFLVLEWPNVVAIAAELPTAHRLFVPPHPIEEKFAEVPRILKRSAIIFAPLLLFIPIALYLRGWRLIPKGVLVVVSLCLFGLCLDIFNATWLSDAPALVSFRFIRFFYVLPFLICVVGAIAISSVLDAVRSNERASSKWVALAVVVPVFGLAVSHDGWIKLNNLRYFGHGSNYTTLYDNPALQDVAAVRDPRSPFRVATLAIEGVTHLGRPSYPWAMGLETIDGYANIYPRAYHQYWMHMIRAADGKVGFHYSKMRDWGNKLYLISKATSCDDIRLEETVDIEMLSLLNTKYIVSPCRLQDDWLRLFSETTPGQGQAWHQLSKREKFMTMFDGDFPSEELFVYENLQVLPRYFVAQRIRSYGSIDDVSRALGHATREDLLNEVHVLDNVGSAFSFANGEAGETSDVTVVEVSKNHAILDVETSAPGILVIAMNYNARWKAMVNGQSQDVVPLNITFQGVEVPAGSSRVELNYTSAVRKLISE